MTERRFPIEVQGIEYVCDECGKGTMQPHGQTVCIGPVPHNCDHCGARRTFGESYPLDRLVRAVAEETEAKE